MSPDLLLTNDLVLRPMAADDESIFVDLLQRSGQRPAAAKTEFQRLLKADKLQVFLLETKAGQELVGHLDWSQANTPLLQIDPNHRLRGYAMQTLDRVLRNRADLHELCLKIRKHDEAATRLLKNCGFQRTAINRAGLCSYRLIDGNDRNNALDWLDARFLQANEDLVADLHGQLCIPSDYGRVHKLEPVFDASELTCIGNDIYARRQYLIPDAASAWQELLAAAEKDGECIQLVSAYRSMRYQDSIIRRKLNAGASIDEILKVSAAPGYSEHHSGRAVDVTTRGSATLEEEFEASSASAWLLSKAGRFGFRLSYPRDNRHGLAYEPWHWAFLDC